MNKIFKVVWNRTIGSFVVTSELAKGRVKSSSEGAEGDVRASEEGGLKTLFRLTALSAALLGFSEGAWAAMNTKPATGGAVFAIGDGSTSANGTGALAIGNNAQAKTNGALAIGPNSTHTTIANGNNAIAIGVNLQATGQKAIGIGTDTTANGSGAIAIGNNDANRMANQGVNGNGAIGVGSNLTANGNNAIAVGTEAQATAISAVAVGANTQATGAEAVAIGKGAASTASKALAFGQGARAQAGNTVAFGTGAQATQDGSIAIGTNTIATGVYGEKSRKGKAIAIGYNTNALGESSIAIGTDDSFYGALTASSRQGIAIGTGAKATGATQSIALGPDAISSGTQSTSIGNNTRATGDSSIAIGGDDWNIVREKTVAAAGNKQVHQVFQDLTGMPMKQQGEAYGNPFKGTTAGDAAVAIGVAALAEGALSTAFGSGTSASGVGAAAFGVGATASQNKSVAIGAGSHTRTDATAVTEATVNGVTYRGFAGTEHITTGSQVSFGSAGYERQLKHVAPGAITSTSTDAINGSQLYALHVGAGNIAKSVADALGGGATVGNDPTNNQGSFVTLPSYDVLKGSDTPNTAGNGTAKFNTTPAKNVAAALTNLNTYVNQGFAVKDNAGAAKGIVTPGESVQFADGNATTVTVDTEANGNTKIKYDVKVDDKTIKVVDGKLTGTSQTHFYSVKNEDQTKGNYNNDGATGDNALAAGVDASATANGTTAVGLKAQASAESAIAVGSETKAAAKNAVVIGNKASVEAATGSVANVNGTTTGEGSVAVGAASKASGTNATAVGQAANAFGQNSFAGGQNSKASGKSSVAIGDGANATDDSSSAVGPYAQATKSGASAFGYYANALGENSLAAGRNAQATNANAVALGNESKATGQNTIAFGNNANASQNQAMALGRNTVASAGYTVALGDEAKATATKAIAFGSSAQATGTNSVATGVQAKAHANDALAVGSNANASGESAIAFGSSAQATGTNSVATGVQAKAHADDALAVGSNANASGESAIALGKQSNAWKVNSLAFGNSANSNGERAIAIGLESVSNGQNAVSVGQKAYAHEHGVAIGSESNAAQAAAIAIGNKAQAMKYSSIVIGEEAKSNNSRSVVIGYHASATNPAMSASNQDTNQTVAIGAYANAWGDQSTAIGNNVDAKGNSSIAIGADDWDTVAVKTVAGTGKTVKQVYQDYTGDVMETGDDTYTHTTSGEAAVAIGTKSQATAELSTAFGTGTRAEGVASAAFGMGAKATKGNSVAIGAGSTTATDATSVNEATVNNLKYSGFAGGNNVNPGDQVSFGTAGYERQLKNVAPGEISSASTDAINGSQLYAVQNVLGNTAKTVKDVLGGNAKLAEDGSLTTRDIGGTGQNTIDAAIRELNTNAYKPFKLTIAKTGGTNGVSENHTLQDVTSGSTITLEAGKNIALRQNGATVSINTVDNPEFTGKVTAKGGLDMGGNKITNVLSGTDTKDAVNLGQLQDAMANLRVSTLTTVNNDAPFSYVGTDGRILRREVTVDQGTGVKTVSFKHIDDSTPYTGDVTIAALNPTDPQTTTPTTVGNVKNGAKDNDAVNVSQLNKIAEAIGTKVNPDGTITAPTYNVISGDPSKASVANYNKVGDALTALSNAVRTPLNFEGDTGTKFDRQLGSTVAVKGGQTDKTKLSDNNIGVVSDDQNHTLNVKLAKELTGLTSAAFSGDVTAAGTTVNGSGVTIGSGSNPVSLTAGGLSNGGNKVTNIADGVADNDAASYKQVKAAKTEVQAGTNVAEVKKTDGADGQAIYTVNAKGTVVSASGADNGLKLTSSEDTTTNVTTYNLDLSDKTKASLTKADSALQNIGVQVNGADAKTLTKDDSTLNFVDGTGTTAENKNGTVAFNVNKSTLTAGTDGTVNAGKTGDAFATAADVAQAINEAVANSEKTSVVEKGDNTHVAVVEAGNKTTYTVHADKTTVSVKADGKLALKSSETTSSNQTKTTNYELDLTDAAKAEIQKGVEAKNIVDTKGITFNGNSGSPVTKKLDETLAIKGDNKNVVTEAGTDGIKVKLKDDITLTSVTADTLKAGDSVLTNDGLNIANGTASAPVSLTKSGLNNGGNKITKVAKGENEDDAVNYAQLKELADKGLTFDADGSTSTSSKKLGERVGIKGGSNITTSADNDNVTVKLNDDITLTSVTATTLKAGDSTLTNAGLVTPKVTAGNSVLEDNGLTISNGAVNAPVSLTKNGLDNGNNKIAKVAKGTADTDAVNVEQIKPLAAALNTTVGADGTVGQPSFTVKQADGTAGTAVHTVQDALNKVSDELNKGLTIAADNGNADKVNLGETVTYTSKDKNIVTTVGSNEIDFSLANTVTVGKNASGGNPVTIDGTNGTVSGLTNKTLGGTNFAVKGQAATEEQINAAQTNLADVLGTGSTNQNGTVTVADIGETGKTTVSDAIKSVKETAEKGWNLQANGDTAEKVAAGETVTFKDGKNIKVTRDGKNITVATSNEVAFDKVTVGGSELTGAGLNTPKVTAGDSELNGSGLTISNGTAGSSVSLTKNGLNNGGNKITKVAEGTLAADSTDAVNGAQLYKVDQKANTNAENIAKGINVGGTEGSKKYALGDTVNIKGDSNIVSETVEGGVQLKLADTVKIGQDTGKPVSIDGTTGTVSGLSNTTLGGTGFATSNKAATEAQLDATQVNLKNILGGDAENTNGNIAMSNIGGTNQNTVHDAIKSVKETAEKGWKLKVNEETSAQAEKISPDDEVAIKQGKNITVTRDGKNITVATSDDVAFNKVTVGDSVLNGNGLTIANGAANAPVSLTKSGLDNGGNKASNIAKGTADTDAVNVEQLKPIAAALNTTVNPITGEVAAPAFTVTKADGTKNTAVGTVQEALDKVGEELKKGLVIAADEGSSEKVNLGDTVTYTGTDGNIKTKTLPGGKVDFGLNDKVTLGKAGGTPIVLDGTNGTVSGLTNKTLGGTDFATKGQAATEEQLNASQVNLKTILGGNAENTNGNIAMSNIGGTNQNTVHDAIKSVKETAEKGWKLKVNEETSSEKISPDDEVAIKEGKNIKVTRDGKNITVATSDDVEFNAVNATNVIAETVIAGNSVLTTEGLKIGADNSPSQVSLTTAGLSNGGNKIAKVAKGTEDTDGVNVSQIKPLATALNTTVDTDGSIAAPNFTVKQADGTAGTPVHTVQEALDKVSDELTKGLNIVADNGSSEKVNLGDTVTYTSKDKNIVTTSGTGKAIDFSLAEKVTIGKDAANGGKPVVIDGKEGIVSGLTNTTLGSAPLAGSNKAATEAQLDATQVNLATILGGNAANNNGNVTTNNIGGTGKDNVHEAIAAVKETADKGWNLKANDETDSEKIAVGDTVTVKQGKNIRVKRSGKELTIETSDDVEFGTVSATTVLADSFISGNSVLSGEGLKIGADGSPSQVSLTNAGLNNGGNKIANVAKGTADTDAVNVAQLNEQLAATEKTTTVVAGKNVTVSEKVDGNNTEYTVNADKTTLSQAANGAVKVSEGAKDADGVTDYALDLTDEAKADIAKGVAAKDAVDNKGLTFAADNGTTGAKKLGDSLSVKGDGNILTRADENGIGFSLADKITVGKAGNGNKPLVIDGTAGLISGLSNTTLGGADFATKGQAASEEQLNAAQANLANLLGGNAANNKGNVTTTDIGGTGKDNVHDAIAAVKETADKGWNLNANDETSSEKIGAGDTVTFKEGKNVKVSRNGKNITVATSDDVSFDKVTVGDSVLTDNGLTVGNGKAGKPVSLTKDGLNNGGNKIANVAKGTDDTDAVNVAQLKAAAAKATSKVDSGNDNIVVTPEQNADGSTTYKVATAPNLKADSFTAGDTVVNNDGVKIGDKVALGKDGLKAGDVNITADGINAGNKAISNVAAGVKDTDAANVGQLNRLTAAAKTEVEAGTNIAGVTSKQGANGQTVYTVNADGASVSAGSDNIVVTKGNKDANNVTDYAVDLSKAVKADIAKGVAAKDAVDNKGISFAGDSGTTVANKLGDTVAVKGDANITTTAGANGIQVGLNKDLKVDSVKAGDTVVNNNGVNVGDKVALGKDGLKAGDVNITADGINAGGKKVTGVAAGTVAAGSTDAVNGGQLHQVYELIGSNGGNVNTAPPSVEADGKAGLGNIKNITLVDNSNNPNVTNVTNETKIAQSNGYSLVTYNVEDQGMYVTNNVIEAVGRMNEQGIKFFHTNDGEVNPDVQARNSEDSSASGAYATAVGFQAASKGTNAIAIGKGAKANAENTIAIGTGNIVSGKNSGAIGDPTVVSGNSSYSIGNNNNVSADNAYALGSNIKATVNDSVYLGDRAQTQGIHTADAAKGEAYTYGGLNDKAVAGKAGSAAAANKVVGVVTVGNGTDETRQVQGVAAGVVSADSTDAINGSQLYYTNQAIANVATQATAAKTEVTAGKNVVVNQTTGNNGQTVYNVATADKLDVTSVTAGGVTVNAQGVSIAAPTAHNPANTVSLSPIGLNNGGQRITNVAPAKEGTDAVNLNQLAGVGNALQNNIERVGKKAYAGVAGAIAQGSIPQVTRPGATGIGVGSGYYGGQSAMAIGVSAMSDGGNWVVKGNFSANTDGHVGVGAGALYQW